MVLFAAMFAIPFRFRVASARADVVIVTIFPHVRFFTTALFLPLLFDDSLLHHQPAVLAVAAFRFGFFSPCWHWLVFVGSFLFAAE